MYNNSADNTAPVKNTRGGEGNLQINVFRNSRGMPAEGANVYVIDQDSGKTIGEAKTDATGRVPPLTLTAPPLEYSLDPEAPRPFNQYDVTVSFPEYNEAIIKNVQIFPGCTSLQKVALVPAFSEVTIPYPVLWGDFEPKIPESAIKKLPFPDNLVVLPEPVIPELVVVHAGVPTNAAAANYTVGFRDYVKNVASSEIYATWPTETLRANILAIISFTLNRVYTEWYRGKGYDFTITNSTAFDQAFTYGRNVYKEISDVVDEVFTTYISKENINQPLFTQYCDGKAVQCDGWLSQWGSKYLGEDGYSSLQILKNYYGYEIVLKQAKKVEGIPISFPGVLSIGSEGDSVRTIQHQLNVISGNYPLIPKLIEDGVYGAKTEEAVKTFQGIFNLPVTGGVNFPTWYSISDIYVAVAKLAK
ncbi:MAG: peptidoglycan-binding protein [Oscillospiraceae bacterium]|nr:peptidoglycan-binding protein [Oscillospiraceae bacterium]